MKKLFLIFFAIHSINSAYAETIVSLDSLKPLKNAQPIEKISIPILPKIGLIICLLGIIFSGVVSNLYEYVYSLCSQF